MEINITSSTISSYRDFMRTIQKTLYATWGKDKVRFTSAYPKVADSKSIIPPIITYSAKEKLPGKMKNAAEIKPRFRELIETDETETGKKVGIELWGQVFDYKILFEVWAEDGDRADELVENFQKFMFQYTGYFKQCGIQEIIFDSITEDDSPKWRTDLTRRRLIYYVKLDEVTGIRCPELENVDVDVSIHDSQFSMIFEILKRNGSL